MPTLFVETDKYYDPSGALARAIQQVAFGATVVQALVTSDEVEADIAVTTLVEVAQRMIQETEFTTVVVIHSTERRRSMTEAVANRVPRILSAPIIGRDGEENSVLLLQRLIVEKTKKEEV